MLEQRLSHLRAHSLLNTALGALDALLVLLHEELKLLDARLVAVIPAIHKHVSLPTNILHTPSSTCVHADTVPNRITCVYVHTSYGKNYTAKH